MHEETIRYINHGTPKQREATLMFMTPAMPFFPQQTPDGSTAHDVVQRAVAGDPAAIAALLRAIRASVVIVVRRILGASPADAEDAIQQTFIAFIHALPTYRGEASPAGFAKTIAVRTAIAIRKNASLRAGRIERDAETIESEAPPPSDAVAAERRRALMRQLLDEIPSEQAEAIAMRVLLGWSLDEIASAANVPVNTVRSRIRLAKEALRKKIEASPMIQEELGV